MKILYVITALGVGGAENLLVDVCREMKKHHQITVAYLLEPADFHAKLAAMDINVIFIDRKKLGLVGSFFALRRIMKHENIDIVHTHLPSADTLGRLAALSIRRVRVVSTIHNSDLWKLEKSPLSLILRGYNRLSVNLSKRARLIAVSQSAKDFCCEREKIRPDKITVIYNFIDFENPIKSQDGFVFPLAQTGSGRVPENDRMAADGRMTGSERMAAGGRTGAFTIITAARMEPNKGHLLLLKAVRLLVTRRVIPELRLMLLGEGSCEQELKDYAEQQGLSENVHFMGVHPNIYDYFRAADLMVLPSQNEGQSIAILEAFYCGTPVLASDIPANSEQLRGGENGALFSLAGGEEALAAAIQSFSTGKQEVEVMKENARAYCLSLTAEHHIQALGRVYEDESW